MNNNLKTNLKPINWGTINGERVDFIIEEYDEKIDFVTALQNGEILHQWMQIGGYHPMTYLEDEAGECDMQTIKENLKMPHYDTKLIKTEKTFSISHLIEELNESREDIDFDFIYEYENCSNYISDIISTAADSYIDIYYEDLKKFASEHVDMLEEAISSGIVDVSDYDFYNHIRMAQFLYYDYKLRENQKEAEIYYILRSLKDNDVEEITEEEYNIIYDLEEFEKVSELYDVFSEILENHIKE